MADVVLEKVILINFNSFQNEEVPLSKGFTIITGPNGAGKSTIFHAIKFGLSSNERDGRNTKWSDFIKVKQNQGSVELHIREGNNLFKIRRILLKDSAPYYQIQEPDEKDFHKTTVQKIKNLIDTWRYNPDNIFAFVSQGNVTDLKKMSKEEICRYIEQGLGLTSLKDKIKERKDEIISLNNQINSLDSIKNSSIYDLEIIKPKLIRLEEKRKLEKLRNNLEKERSWLNKSKLIQEIQEINQNIEIHKKQITDLESNLIDQDNLIKNIEKAIEDRKSEIQACSEELGVVNLEEKDCTEKINEWQQGKEDYANQILRIKSIIKSLDADIQRNTKEFKYLEDELNKIELELKVLNIEKADLLSRYDINEQLRKKHQETVVEYENKRKILNQYESEIKQKKLELDSIEREIQKYMDEIKINRAELQKYDWYEKEFIKDPDKYKRPVLEENKLKFNQGIEKIENNIKKHEQLIQDFEKELEKIKNSVLMKGAPKPKAILEIIREIKEREIDVIGPLIDVIEFDPRIGPAVDAVFNFYTLNSFIAMNKDNFLLVHDLIKKYKAKCNVFQPLQQEIQKLEPLEVNVKEGIYGYLANFIKPIIRHNEIKKLIYSICRNTVLVSDKSVGYDLINLQGHKGNIVTLDGVIIRKREYVLEARGNNEEENYQNPIQLKKKIEEYQKKIEENRAKIEELSNNREILRKAKVLVETRLNSVDSITFYHNKVNIAINTKNNLLEKKKEVVKIKNEFNERLNNLKKEMDELEQKLPANFKEIDEFLTSFSKRLAENDEKIKNVNQKQSQKEKERNNLEITLEKTKKDLQSQTEEQNRIEKLIEERNSKILVLMKKIPELRSKQKSLKENLDSYKKEIDQKYETLKKEQHILSSIKDDISRLSIRIENLIAEKYQKEMVIKNIEIDMKELGENYTPRSIQEVENDIKLNLEKLREYYDISEDLVKKKEELENRIQEISSKKIQVTLEIEEAQKAEKKLEDEFFNEFKEKLKIIENDINERFKNASIQKKGRLELKGNIDSLLVDVFVTFAEGEERNLTTLSGGEQTMFSISLMLTLQELNPSPLCIFDECQMFLDMENSQEVSRLIKNAANKGVQFIIILPDAAKTIIPLADHVIGVAKNGENDISTVIEYDPKEYVKKLV